MHWQCTSFVTNRFLFYFIFYFHDIIDQWTHWCSKDSSVLLKFTLGLCFACLKSLKRLQLETASHFIFRTPSWEPSLKVLTGKIQLIKHNVSVLGFLCFSFLTSLWVPFHGHAAVTPSSSCKTICENRNLFVETVVKHYWGEHYPVRLQSLIGFSWSCSKPKIAREERLDMFLGWCGFCCVFFFNFEEHKWFSEVVLWCVLCFFILRSRNNLKGI